MQATGANPPRKRDKPVSDDSLPNVTPIWTPQDSVDTARQFHLELANAERGRPERWWLTAGRERRARIYDFLAVTLLLATMALLGFAVALLSVTR